MKNNQLFLISSSRYRGGEYFQHCKASLQDFLGPMTKDELIAFVPYALKDHDAYADMARKVFNEIGYNMISVHETEFAHSTTFDNPKVKAVFVGGGNTFRLRSELQNHRIFQKIRDKVSCGELKYIGSSAGSNMACPTIQTTNDMPIVLPPDFDGFKFVTFQINPHFVSGKLTPDHMGESRETRIAEYHEENASTVIGLNESNWIIVDDQGKATLFGEKEAMIFERGCNPREWMPHTQLVL